MDKQELESILSIRGPDQDPLWDHSEANLPEPDQPGPNELMYQHGDIDCETIPVEALITFDEHDDLVWQTVLLEASSWLNGLMCPIWTPDSAEEM